MITEEQIVRAITIAALIRDELKEIENDYYRWLFLTELKEQTGYCWECAWPLGPTGYCTCQMDD